MRTFEEKWTAWLDGELTGKELVEFEASLPDRTSAEAEKRDALKLGSFLREQLQNRPMANEKFFSHQLRETIARDARDQKPGAVANVRSPWWSIGRLARTWLAGQSRLAQ